MSSFRHAASHRVASAHVGSASHAVCSAVQPFVRQVAQLDAPSVASWPASAGAPPVPRAVIWYPSTPSTFAHAVARKAASTGGATRIDAMTNRDAPCAP
jgi:hypothetical protein